MPLESLDSTDLLERSDLVFPTSCTPRISTPLGKLYQADCMSVLPAIPSDSVHTVFADPPFNLGKHYGKKTRDDYPDSEYLEWCRSWLRECVRVLAPGGALFVYHLPRWNVSLGAFLGEIGMAFRHWIAIEHTGRLPILGRLYPSHYSMIYYTKGKPRVFRRIRTPIQTCRHCGGEIKDYGGHRNAMHPKGVTLKDIWTDIPPVRHSKFKSSCRTANALSTKILDRVVQMTTKPGDLVLDPFGGSGTTYAVCEYHGRRWLGIEIENIDAIQERLSGGVQPHMNFDYIEPCQ